MHELIRTTQQFAGRHRRTVGFDQRGPLRIGLCPAPESNRPSPLASGPILLAISVAPHHIHDSFHC